MHGEKYGVLLVSGRWTHQENYALAFEEDPRCRLVAVTDERDVPQQRVALNERLAEDLGVPCIPDLDAALGRSDVDIVSICAEPERRGRVTVRCARAGKHVYIDKPMTYSVGDADAVVAAVRDAGVRSQVFSHIHMPWARRAKRAVESGAIGELVALHADVLFAKGPAGTASLKGPRRETFPPERFTFIDSKRELYAMGVYSTGLVRWLSGREARTVYGVTANYFFREHERNGVEDFGLLALTLGDGITATVTGGRIGWRGHPSGGFLGMHLTGTEGAVRIDPYRPRVEVFADEPAWTPPPVHPMDPMGFWRSTQRESGAGPKQGWIPLENATGARSDASHFVDCVESGRESEMSAADGAAVVEILMAGYLSAAEGQAVRMPMAAKPFEGRSAGG